MDQLPSRELLQRKSLKEEVFELLQVRIVAGEYKPGDWLRQEEIANQLGVSQTPVREALDLLVAVGLAERVPFRGVRVPVLSQEQIVDAYAMRIVLESAAARLAACNIQTDQVIALMKIVEQTRTLVNLEDMPEHRRLNKEFHLSIVEAGGSALLKQLYRMIANLFPDWMLYEYMFRHPHLLQENLEREYEEHRAIAEAIAGRKPTLAFTRSILHLQNLGRELREFLNISGELIEEKEEQLGLND